ncbi:MAG TPA: acyltransferase [Chitinophagaceae bacterium]|jgi:peptidoglycan/LPS O-acetylase OafA/YrhL|nr:acyltransferase [Chitinophagaceae bacterium]
MKTKVYFKNLDGIRFIAAFLVLVHHAFFFKRNFAPGVPYLNHMFEDAGRIGVNLFFVLSGFLISYLLFIEKDTTGTVSYRNFYIRRVLRIWPLYLAIGLFLNFAAPFITARLGMGSVIGFPEMLTNLVFLVLFAVNIQLAFFQANSGVFEISWSVCIEEQFYLIWPIIVNVFRKALVPVFVVMFVLRTLLRIGIVVLPHYFDVEFERLVAINYLLLFDKLDLFGGGMLWALLYYQRDRFRPVLERMMHPALQVTVITLTLLYGLAVVRPPQALYFMADHLICIFLFGYLLLTAVWDRSVLNLEQPLLKTLGKVSYGIYLFHTIICQLVLVLFQKWVGHPESVLLYDVVYPLVCTAATCVLAYFSYEYFEKYFLKRKVRFAVVPTRV